MTRRSFLISLGAGAGASIAGYLVYRLVDASRMSQPQPAAAGSCPKLKDDVVFGTSSDGLATMTRPADESHAICAVNHVGEAVLRLMDGTRTIEEISTAVAAEASIEMSEALAAKVAYFVAHVGMLGFLCQPFHANIFERAE